MAGVLVDSNVILDVVTEDPKWFEWASAQLERLAEIHLLIISPIIYNEISIGFDRIEDLDQALPEAFFRREPSPWEAGFSLDLHVSIDLTSERQAAIAENSISFQSAPASPRSRGEIRC